MLAQPLAKASPERLKMSYEEYLQFTGETQISEWVDGEVINYMPPLFPHQNIVGFLNGLLGGFVHFFNLGIVIPAPFEVKLWPDGPSREPDIIFIGRGKAAQLSRERFTGGPDLLVEVVSTSSSSEDKVYKFTEYQKASVQEYWIIDPRPRKRQMDVYGLGEDGVYIELPMDEEGIYHSAVLPHFWLNPEWLWRPELPNPQLVLSEIIISVPGLSAEIKNIYQSLYDLLSQKK